MDAQPTETRRCRSANSIALSENRKPRLTPFRASGPMRTSRSRGRSQHKSRTQRVLCTFWSFGVPLAGDCTLSRNALADQVHEIGFGHAMWRIDLRLEGCGVEVRLLRGLSWFQSDQTAKKKQRLSQMASRCCSICSSLRLMRTSRSSRAQVIGAVPVLGDLLRRIANLLRVQLKKGAFLEKCAERFCRRVGKQIHYLLSTKVAAMSNAELFHGWLRTNRQRTQTWRGISGAWYD